MFVLGCIAVLGLVVAVMCVGLTVAILYQYYKTTIALEGLIQYTANRIGVTTDEVRKRVINAKRKI